MPQAPPSLAKPNALELFTDRTNEQTILREVLQPAPTTQLGSDKLLTVFYGIGGVGKSTLCHKVIEFDLGQDVHCVLLNLDSGHWNPHKQCVELITELCRCFERERIPVPYAVALLALHSELTGMSGHDVRDIDTGWAFVLDSIDKGVESLGIPGLNLLLRGAQLIHDKARRRMLRSELEKLCLWPTELNQRVDMADLEAKLVLALFYDISGWLEKHAGSHLRLLVDGFERIQSTEAHNDAQRRLQEFVGYFAEGTNRETLGRFRVIVFGREHLRWDELYGDSEWKDYWNQQLLGGLYETDARDFLDKMHKWYMDAGKVQLAEALKQNLDKILDGADEHKEGERVFYPYYLNLGIELLQQAVARKSDPDFGRASAELQERFFKYLEKGELRALMILALAEKFNDSLFNWLAKEQLIDFPVNSFHSTLSEHSFLQPPGDESGFWRFHRLFEKALQEKWKVNDTVRAEGCKTVQLLLEYYGKSLIDKELRDWSEEDIERWKRGMEILVTQGPEMEIVRYDEWSQWIEEKPWCEANYHCIQSVIEFTKRIMIAQEKILGPEHPRTFDTIDTLGVLLRDKGDYDSAERLLRRALEGREKVLGPAHTDTLLSVINLALVLSDEGHYDSAEKLCRRALEGSERILGLEHLVTLTCVNNLALVLYDKGEYDLAERLHRRALEGYEKVLGPEHARTLSSVNNLAMVLCEKGDYDSAERLYRRALEGYEKILGPECPDTLRAVNNLAMVLCDKGDYDSAERLYRRALEGHEKILGSEHPDTLTSVDNLATVLCDKGDYDSAESLYRRALEGREKILGSEHPDTLTSVNNLANVLRYKGDYDSAEGLFRRALESREKVLGQEHPHTLLSVNNLAGVLHDKGDYDSAEQLYRRALEVSEKTLGPEHPDTLLYMNNLALVLYDRRDYGSAERLYRRVLEVLEKMHGLQHPDTLESVNGLANVLRNKGDYDSAEQLYKRALEGREKMLGAEHPKTLGSVNDLGVLLRERGDYDSAERVFRRALEGRQKALGPEHPHTRQSLGACPSNPEKR